MRTPYLLVSLFLLSACGSGSNSPTPAAVPALPAPPVVSTGVFTDSPVNALSYNTATQSGTTNVAGEFKYQAGESVQFSVGGIVLGSATGAAELSPLNLSGVTTLDQARANSKQTELLNRLLFLQSLDRDQNPDNGIDLDGLDLALAAEQLDFSDPEFSKGNFRKIVSENGGYFQSEKNALNHLLETLQQTVAIELLTRENIDLDGDGTFDVVIDLIYNEQGLLVKKTSTDIGSAVVSSIQEIEYDANNNPAKIVTGSTVQTIENHPTFGIISSVTTRDDIILSSEQRVYDAFGNLTASETTTNFLDLLQSSPVPAGFSSIVPLQIFSPGQLTRPLPSDVLEATGENSNLAGIILSPGLATPIATTTTNNMFDEQGRLTQATLTFSLRASLDEISDNERVSNISFSYNGFRPDNISITNSFSEQMTEIALDYSAAGKFLGCTQSIDSIPATPDAFFFSLANPAQPIPGNILGAERINTFITCSEFVEYDALGRVLKIEQPATNFQASYTQEFEYAGSNIIRSSFTLNTDPVQTRVHTYLYSDSGQLLEETLTVDGIKTYARVLAYTIVTLDQLPR